jgi:hypothetical protein
VALPSAARLAERRARVVTDRQVPVLLIRGPRQLLDGAQTPTLRGPVGLPSFCHASPPLGVEPARRGGREFRPLVRPAGGARSVAPREPQSE